MTDKPQPPDDSYEVMLGKDVPSPIPAKTMFWCVGSWDVSSYCGEDHLTSKGDRESWYAVPLVEASTPKKDLIGTDPKKFAGDKKPQLQLIPAALNTEMAKVLQNGAEKYGAWNWRENKVETMTYIGAMRRHLDDFVEGENNAPDSGVHHLGHVAANCAILLDALKHGTLVDNRPQSNRLG